MRVKEAMVVSVIVMSMRVPGLHVAVFVIVVAPMLAVAVEDTHKGDFSGCAVHVPVVDHFQVVGVQLQDFAANGVRDEDGAVCRRQVRPRPKSGLHRRREEA